MYNSIGMPEFDQLLKKEALKIIDVREVDEFSAGHIKGAKNLPLSNLQNTFNELSKNQAYYIICQSGGRSSMACQFLAGQGFQVTNVMGGMSAWRGSVEHGM